MRLTPLALAAALAAGPAFADRPQAATSPWGPDDQIGRLNMMTDASRAAILSRLEGGKVYDLAVEYHKDMPSWSLLGDPTYQIWMTHTPRGTAVDDVLGLGREMHEMVSYSGDAVLMYTQYSTQWDGLGHVGQRRQREPADAGRQEGTPQRHAGRPVGTQGGHDTDQCQPGQAQPG